MTKQTRTAVRTNLCDSRDEKDGLVRRGIQRTKDVYSGKGRQTNRERDIDSDKQRDRQTDRQTDRDRDRDRDRQTDR